MHIQIPIIIYDDDDNLIYVFDNGLKYPLRWP